ncbi:adenylate kinase family protein [Candidatus Phytoplasma oryzae]|uniref:Adenylate kinase n=1 Tax=Candidatus Phytoplasma oryzae TaxID=203274 RepID=A0A139JR01_9MOLU|nr:nucleoside monophosphate kinase [Candidatus Phytoplasma oryzae]KXT29280.1 adenylate kinase family protein [Candidatus Phytoplasma oryzae]
MKIILLGPPATGKGTQSTILSKYFKIPHICVGEIFRKNIQKKTELGKIIHSYIQKGLLVPDEITNKIISEYLEKKEIKKGFILDGFPRNLKQAYFLTKELEKKKIDLTKVIYLNSNEEFLKKRIIGRIICPKCGEIYHKETKIPKIKNFCDNDKNLLIQRKDDNIETFSKRLNIYKIETFPIIKYYKKMNKVLEISTNDDERSIIKTTEIILEKLLNK